MTFKSVTPRRLSCADEDHLRDFKNVMQDCTVPWILSNPTIGPREFAILKKDGMGPGARAVAAWLAQPKSPFPAPQPDFGDVQIRWLSYWRLSSEMMTSCGRSNSNNSVQQPLSRP
jgi:hypothetical protein